ncbi:hypothetical protein AB0J74_13630 [Asanoa sp. NPDC049573]|uniref:hypothetical protein n=1 Tax=Asanoa sp. NPDC049573 TaxID=3155396 RepID=UPI0034473326
MRDQRLVAQLGALWVLGGVLVPSGVGALAVLLFGGSLGVGLGSLLALAVAAQPDSGRRAGWVLRR